MRKYAVGMQLKPHDVVAALKLAVGPRLTYPRLAEALDLSLSEAHGAVKRATAAGLLLANRTPNRPALIEFVIHGVRYAYPAVRGGMTRGVPTAHAAPPLVNLIVGDNEPPPVWPDPKGEARGAAFSPLYPGAANASRTDPKLYECLSLIDALRGGRARERNLAKEHLTRLLNG
jgi:hypothetical protein